MSGSLLLASLAASVPLRAQGVRVSEIEPRHIGDVSEMQGTPDGAWVVYRADHVTGGTFSLFAAPTDGSAPPHVLSQEPPLTGFAVAAGNRVLYSLGSQLLSQPIDGGSEPQRLDFAARDLVLSSDGTHAVYSRYGTGGLFVCPVDVAQPVRLSWNADPPFQFTPDGEGLVFSENVIGFPYAPYTIFWLVPIDGSSSATFLSSRGAYGSLRQVGDERIVFFGNGLPNEICTAAFDGTPDILLDLGTDFRLSADGRRVLYRSTSGHLSSVLAPVLAPDTGHARGTSGGGARASVSPGPVDLGLVVPSGGRLELTRDGTRAVAIGHDASGQQGLYVVRIDGAGHPLLIGISTGSVTDFVLTGDDEVALFTARGELHSVPLDLHRPALTLTDSQVAGGKVKTILSSTASGLAVFTADHLQVDVFELFAVPIEGGASPVRLNAPLPPGCNLDLAADSVELTPDGTRVIFRGAQNFPGVHELFAVRSDGSAPPALLSTPRPLGLHPRQVFDFQVPESGPIVFRTNAEDETLAELYSFGAQGLRKISGPRTFGNSSGVVSYRLSRDGERVVYGIGVGFAIDDSPFDLFGVPTDGSGPPVRLGPADGAILSYELDPTGNNVLLLRHALDEELFSVPVLGGDPVFLSPLVDVRGYAPTPDGTRVAFCGLRFPNRMVFVSPIDGSRQPAALCGFATGYFNPVLVRVAPDSRRVVWETDDYDERNLYSVALDGSESGATRLAPAYSAEQPHGFEITPDSSHVVLQAATGTGRVDLFSVPITGGSLVLLSGALPTNRAVTAFETSPDGARVVFIADALVNDQYELFSVPVDGSQAPVRLNRAPVTGGDVTSLAISPDGTRVAYIGDVRVDQRSELFSVLIDGFAPDLSVTGPIAGSSDVTAFRHGPHGFVVYLLDQGAVPPSELFTARIDGAGTPERISSPPVAGGDVLSFQLGGNGARVFYLADQEFDGSPELFLSLVRAPARVR